jgi:hypothetical protein
MAEHLQQSHNGGGGHERSDTGVKIIVYSALGLAVGMVIVCLIVVGIFRGMQKVMPHPADEYQALRQHEDEVLNHYGWVDQKAGVVRLPIDKAMDILAKRGFPTKSELTAGNANSNSR